MSGDSMWASMKRPLKLYDQDFGKNFFISANIESRIALSLESFSSSVKSIFFWVFLGGIWRILGLVDYFLRN